MEIGAPARRFPAMPWQAKPTKVLLENPNCVCGLCVLQYLQGAGAPLSGAPVSMLRSPPEPVLRRRARSAIHRLPRECRAGHHEIHNTKIVVCHRSVPSKRSRCPEDAADLPLARPSGEILAAADPVSSAVWMPEGEPSHGFSSPARPGQARFAKRGPPPSARTRWATL